MLLVTLCCFFKIALDSMFECMIAGHMYIVTFRRVWLKNENYVTTL